MVELKCSVGHVNFVWIPHRNNPNEHMVLFCLTLLNACIIFSYNFSIIVNNPIECIDLFKAQHFSELTFFPFHSTFQDLRLFFFLQGRRIVLQKPIITGISCRWKFWFLPTWLDRKLLQPCPGCYFCSNSTAGATQSGRVGQRGPGPACVGFVPYHTISYTQNIITYGSADDNALPKPQVAFMIMSFIFSLFP